MPSKRPCPVDHYNSPMIQTTRPPFHGSQELTHLAHNFTNRSLLMSNNTAEEGSVGNSRPPAMSGDRRKCMLPTCNKSARVDSVTGRRFDFCCKSHMLAMEEEHVRKWKESGVLCKLETCVKHVYLEGNRTHDYCSWGHAKLDAAMKGLSMASTKPLEPGASSGREARTIGTVTTVSNREGLIIPTPPGPHERVPNMHTERGYDLTTWTSEELHRCLLAELENGSSHVSFDDREGTMLQLERDISIYQHHPWEIVEGFRSRYFIGWAQDGDSRRTKDNFTFRQSGKTYNFHSEQLQKRYFEYELDRVQESVTVPTHVKVYMEDKNQRKRRTPTRWRMHEIILVNNQTLTRRPTIWKVFQDPYGQPVWPPQTLDPLAPTSQEPSPTLQDLPDHLVDANQDHASGNVPGQELPQSLANDNSTFLIDLSVFDSLDGLLGFGHGFSQLS